MATIVLDVQDESLLTQIKKACQLLRGVASVRVHKAKNEDITKTHPSDLMSSISDAIQA